MGLSKEDMAEIAAMIASANAPTEPEQDAVTSKVLKDAPKPATQANVKRARATGAKASAVAVERELVTFMIAGGKAPKKIAAGASLPEGVVFVVAPVTQPHRTGGTLTTAGSRLYAYQDGRALKSWTGPVVAAFTGDVQEAAAGVMAQVDELALIGAHRPIKAEDAD